MKQFSKSKHVLLMVSFLFVLLFATFVSAGLFSKDKEVWMSVNQSEYYVPLNVQAALPLEINNDFDTSVDSLFTFTITQTINQAGMQSTSSNSQTKTMPVTPKNQTLMLGIGPSSSEGEIQIDISLAYTDPKTLEQKTSILNGIIIHFVNAPQDNQSQTEQQQQQSKEEQKKANQEKRSTQQTQDQNGQQNEQNQNIMQQLQQQMKQMQNPNQNQQIPTQSQSQQNLQNNQQAQDMNALKQQMEQQKQKQQEQENQFKQNVAQNQEFLEENKKLEEQGYKMQSLSAQADSNNSGKFNADYKNDKGESAQMQGEMNNNSMQNIQSQTQQQKDAMKSQMMNSSDFKKLDEMLNKEGYNISNLQYGALNNDIDNNVTKTELTANYINNNNETVQVNAEFVNNSLKKVSTDFEKDNHNNLFWLILFIVILIAALIGMVLYYNSKKKKNEDVVVEDGVKEEPEFDYVSYCKKELESAKKLFGDSKDEKDKGYTAKDRENKKESYAKCANALRVFYSYKFGDKSEIVNADALKIAKKQKFNHELLNDTLNLCMLVEFAKYKPNKADFDDIYKNSKKIIEK